MERKTFVLKLKRGMKPEYVRRHEGLWPEMLEMLKEAGVSNYSIWWHEDLLFGYYEAESIDRTEAFKRQSPVQRRWRDYMADLMDEDAHGNAPPEQVFFLA